MACTIDTDESEEFKVASHKDSTNAREATHGEATTGQHRQDRCTLFEPNRGVQRSRGRHQNAVDSDSVTAGQKKAGVSCGPIQFHSINQWDLSFDRSH